MGECAAPAGPKGGGPLPQDKQPCIRIQGAHIYTVQGVAFYPTGLRCQVHEGGGALPQDVDAIRQRAGRGVRLPSTGADCDTGIRSPAVGLTGVGCGAGRAQQLPQYLRWQKRNLQLNYLTN